MRLLDMVLGRAHSIDEICGHPLPIVQVKGWADTDSEPDLRLRLSDGAERSPDFLYRVRRPDVVAAGSSRNAFAGFLATFIPCLSG